MSKINKFVVDVPSDNDFPAEAIKKRVLAAVRGVGNEQMATEVPGGITEPLTAFYSAASVVTHRTPPANGKARKSAAQ